MNKNKDNIDNTISSLPEIASNLSAITGEIREGVQTIAATAEIIENNIGQSSSKLTEKTAIAIDGVQIFSMFLKKVNYFC